MEYNHAIYQMLVNYLSIEQDLGKGQTVKIIDFENPGNNEFLCVNQFKVEGLNQNIIPDIVCFVNGLLLAVIECKSPHVADAIAKVLSNFAAMPTCVTRKPTKGRKSCSGTTS